MRQERPAPLTVFRDGFVDIKPGTLETGWSSPSLDAQPRYFIVSPFVFSQTTQDYLKQPAASATRLWPQAEPVGDPALRQPAFEQEELVIVVSPLFPITSPEL
jgi:hypothetical protein